ncbi:MAG TPA: hypothetical protein VFE12_01580, partial [Acetobacteraceae bacterium]|nr:hypothetical protein [Acetobacteraceae bacterium]
MPRKPTQAERRKTAGSPTATSNPATSAGTAARIARKKVSSPVKGKQPAEQRRAGRTRTPAAAPVPAPSPPDISIAIDPVVWGGRINGRFDVQIRGRVVSSETIEEVELLADGLLVSRVRFGQPERLTGQSRPGQWDYQFTLPRLQEYANIRCPCVIRARTSEGRERDEPFEVLVDLHSPDPVKGRFQPTQRGVGHDETRPPIVCYVERAALDVNGNFEMCGWTVAMAPIVTAQVLLEGDSRALAADIGGLRGDVAKAYPGYPDAEASGFVLATRTDQSLARTPTSATLQTFSLDGCSQELTIPLEYVASLVAAAPPPAAPTPEPPAPAPEALDRPAADPAVPEQEIVPGPPQAEQPSDGDARRQIHFFCDQAGVAADRTVRVTGWAVSAVGIASIGIYLDGEKLGDAELGLPRTDVGEAHAEIPMARFSGFLFERRVAEIGEGEHDLWIAVHNGMDDVFSATRLVHAHIPPEPDARATEAAAPIEHGPKPATDPSEFRFSLDNPLVVAGSAVNPITGRLTIEGWAMAQSGVTSIAVHLDEQRLGEAHCGLARQDVAIAYPDWANSLRSGFAFHCPPRSLQNGKHVIRLILRASNGQEMLHSFQIEIRRPEGDDEQANIRRRMT